jgi:peptide-N4-(N-acetyl-beta-glucosaminyl)asparagine amidase
LEYTGRASRVEVYKCKSCGAVTRFPRFNDPKTLLSPEGRRGRCGEYANAFTCILRSVGFEARYVLDFTDHVWCEYYSYKQDRWIHIDPCEAKVDGCGVYEKGWNKKLSYIFAASKDEICDVSGKYTRKLGTPEMKQRRSLAPELVLDAMIYEIDRVHKLKRALPPQRVVELQRRRTKETEAMEANQGKVRLGKPSSILVVASLLSLAHITSLHN